MNVLDLLKGKRMSIKTDVGTFAELEIKEVKQNHHSQDLAPATAANDWWPPSRDWATFTVYFTNGYSKVYSSISEIQVMQ